MYDMGLPPPKSRPRLAKQDPLSELGTYVPTASRFASIRHVKESESFVESLFTVTCVNIQIDLSEFVVSLSTERLSPTC